MHSKSKLVESKFTVAEQTWNLEQLYSDLAKTKEKSLTAVEKSLLRGLLCGYSPAEIASIIYQNRSSSTVRVYLSNGLYKYIEEMLSFQTGSSVKIQNWSRVAQLLEKAGYKKDLPIQTNYVSVATDKVSPVKQDWGEAIDVTIFYGREQELRSLQQWIVHDQCRLVAIVGVGGVGKTTLAVKTAKQVQEHFHYVIWRSLAHTPRVEDILDQLLRFFTTQPIDSSKTVHEKISQLLQYLRAFRCLIVLDRFETILDTGDRVMTTDHQGYVELIQRLGESSHQSCLVVTSREQLNEIAAIQGTALPVKVLKLTGISLPEAASILKVKGAVNFSDEECQFLIDCYAGNPLFIKIAATTIQDLFANNITQFIAQGNLFSKEIRKILAQQVARLSALEAQILYCLTLNPEMTLSDLQHEISLDVFDSELWEAIACLQRRNIVDIHLTQLVLQKCFAAYLSEVLSENIYQSLKNYQGNAFCSKRSIHKYLRSYILEHTANLSTQD